MCLVMCFEYFFVSFSMSQYQSHQMLWQIVTHVTESNIQCPDQLKLFFASPLVEVNDWSYSRVNKTCSRLKQALKPFLNGENYREYKDSNGGNWFLDYGFWACGSQLKIPYLTLRGVLASSIWSMYSRPSKIYQVGVVLAVGPCNFSDSPSPKMDFSFRIWLLGI